MLVVGCGASGSQIAEELCNAEGKFTYQWGQHRPPRAYRQRDYCWWLGALGLWDEVKATGKKRHVAFAVSGYEGGRTVDFRRLAHKGITLVGVTESYGGGRCGSPTTSPATSPPGTRRISTSCGRRTPTSPARHEPAPEPEAWTRLPDPDCLTNPIASLDLGEAGITTILWATGYRYDFGWLDVDVFDRDGLPVHKRGISAENGIYFLGLPDLTNRASAFIYGCWQDAKYIADHIVIQRRYDAYERQQAAE